MIQEAINRVNEADEYLNISIKNVDKVVKDEKSAADLIKQEVEVFGKYDGTKLSLLRTDADWKGSDWWDLFVVSYKGNVIYGTEYMDVHPDADLDSTVGVSQYKTVIDYVADNYEDWKSIPKNTEFFVEFLMNKPTLTRKYTKLRQLVLIGHSPVSSVKIAHGKIHIKSKGLIMEDREKYAKILGLNLPELIFEGRMIEFPKGLNARAKEFYKDFADSFKGLPADGFWELAKNFFKMLPSLYGSEKEEGVVIHLSKPMGGTPILKIVQDDQYDKELRFKIKQQYKMEVKDEDEYWLKVRASAEEIINTMNLGAKFPKVLRELSRLVYKEYKLSFTHGKKTELNIRDDIQLTAKNMLMRKLPGNNGALVVGKFRVFTNGHKKMFDQALKGRDFLVVALVSNKETKSTLELRKAMIQATYPKVEIITTTSGNLLTMINKTSQNINVVLAGSDRVDAYRNQLKRNLDVQVEEVRRGEDDESATKVIQHLSDFKYFKKNTPRAVHKFYDELVKTYKQGESFRTHSNMLREVTEAVQQSVNIKNLKKLAMKEPTFIFLMGGTGSGKNYTYEKYLKGIPLIDLDDYTKEFAEEYCTEARKQVSRATARSKRELLSAFSSQKSIVQMGTGNNIKSTSNKFKWAKEHGLKVVVVLVDVDPKVALRRNKERHAGGESRLVPDEKVVRTVQVAKDNSKIFAKDSNVDFVIIQKN
jgi:predicted kinase/nicotinamide mononucleotide adenylyltransferase